MNFAFVILFLLFTLASDGIYR
ncbi:Protein of unknown function [Bacillus cereus]|nr:Protein of unknown function [Bacillus cereus]